MHVMTIAEEEELFREARERWEAMTLMERAQSLVDAGILKQNGEVEDRFKNAFRPIPGAPPNILAVAAKEAEEAKSNGSS